MSLNGSENKAVGLIGAGTMGGCILSELIKSGYHVIVYDSSETARKNAREKGAEIADTSGEVAEKADIIFMSLPKPINVVNVVNGKNGLMNKLTEGKIVVDTSTVDMETSIQNAHTIAEKKAHYVDAPILGRPDSVGNWLLPAGGEKETVDQIRTLCKCFAKDIVYVGSHGMGNAFKLLNQLMFSVINAVSAEVMTLADSVGINKKKFYDVISQSGAATVSGLFRETAGRIVEGRYDDPTFTIDLLCKDAGLGIQMAKDAKVSPFIASYVQTLNETAKDKGLGSKDTSILAEMFEQFYSKMA